MAKSAILRTRCSKGRLGFSIACANDSVPPGALSPHFPWENVSATRANATSLAASACTQWDSLGLSVRHRISSQVLHFFGTFPSTNRVTKLDGIDGYHGRIFSTQLCDPLRFCGIVSPRINVEFRRVQYPEDETGAMPLQQLEDRQQTNLRVH